MAVKTKNRTLSDLVRYEANPIYCRDSGKVANPNASSSGSGDEITVTDPVGYPLGYDAGYYFLEAGNESDCVGLLLLQTDTELLGGGDETQLPQAVLVRGPAIVNKTAIKTVDFNDAEFDVDGIVTALAALSPPVLAYVPPTTESVQTT